MELAIVILYWVLLLGPVALLLLSLVCTYIPGAPSFLMEFFVNYLGEVDLFSSSVAFLTALKESEGITAASFGGMVLQLLFSSMLEAAIIAGCVFAVKISFMTLSRASANTRGGIDQIIVAWRYPVFLLTAVGVLLGVLACGAIGKVALPAVQGILGWLLMLAIMIYGISMMFRTAGRFRRAKQIQNSYAVFANLLWEVLSNMLIALCAVMAVACLFAGPKFVENGLSRWRLAAMYLLCILVIYLTYQISVLLKPRTYTNKTPLR